MKIYMYPLLAFEATMLLLLALLLFAQLFQPLVVDGYTVEARIDAGGTPVFTATSPSGRQVGVAYTLYDDYAVLSVHGLNRSVVFPCVSRPGLRILERSGVQISLTRYNATEGVVEFTVAASGKPYELYIYLGSRKPESVSWDGEEHYHWRWYGTAGVLLIRHPPSRKPATVSVSSSWRPPSIPAPLTDTNITIPGVQTFIDIDMFSTFWNQVTYGSFLYVMPYLALASVYLKTRSISLAILAGVVISVAVAPIQIGVFLALGLAWLIYRAVWRGSE